MNLMYHWLVVNGCHEFYHNPIMNYNPLLVGGEWLPSIFYFPRNIGCLIIPIDEVIFFRGVAQPPIRSKSLKTWMIQGRHAPVPFPPWHSPSTFGLCSLWHCTNQNRSWNMLKLTCPNTNNLHTIFKDQPEVSWRNDLISPISLCVSCDQEKNFRPTCSSRVFILLRTPFTCSTFDRLG